ncbi:hypothetical protein AV530_005292 [Patagioenas fasciata monilis]|uniref:Uncharacterized protein n=1 Tax=Patagioenas fasciata monilis TaxID=372326 RepID=A0A1V4JKU2_PATFA|nr:hypothetical protein AV530_005292 [Patagioenas fasciata monilis]
MLYKTGKCSYLQCLCMCSTFTFGESDEWNVLCYVPSNLVAINTLLINWKSSPSSILTSQTTHERVLEIKEILFHPYPSGRETDGI